MLKVRTDGRQFNLSRQVRRRRTEGGEAGEGSDRWHRDQTPVRDLTDDEFHEAAGVYRNYALVLARDYARTDSDREDMVQEAFLRICAWDRNAPCPFRAVLRVRLWNVYHDWRSKKANRLHPVGTVTDCTHGDGAAPEATEPRPGPLAELTAREVEPLPADVLAAVDAINPRGRAAVRRYLVNRGPANTGHARRVNRAVRCIRVVMGRKSEPDGYPGCRLVCDKRGSYTIVVFTDPALLRAGGHASPVYVGRLGAPETPSRYAEIRATLASQRPVTNRPVSRYSYLRVVRRGYTIVHAAVAIGARKIGLGRFGTPESIRRYHRILSDRGLTPPPDAPPLPT